MSSDDLDKAISEIDSNVDKIKKKKEVEAKRSKIITDAEKIKKDKEQKELEEDTKNAVSFRGSYLFLLSGVTFIYFNGLNPDNKARFILNLFIIAGLAVMAIPRGR